MGLHSHLHGRNSCQPDLQGDGAPASQLPAQTQALELKVLLLLRDPSEPEGTGLREAPGSFPVITAAAERLRLIEEVSFLFSSAYPACCTARSHWPLPRSPQTQQLLCPLGAVVQLGGTGLVDPECGWAWMNRASLSALAKWKERFLPKLVRKRAASGA